MILTCPECATSYFVDDAKIPAAGRSVKCSSCDARWIARLEPDAPAPDETPPPRPTAPFKAAVLDDIDFGDPPDVRPAPAPPSQTPKPAWYSQ